MLSYEPPVDEYRFLLDRMLRIHERADLPPYADLDPTTVEIVLREMSKIARDVMLPLRAPSDRQGCVWDGEDVKTPPGFVAAYRTYQDGGWAGLGVDAEFGGQGLPRIVTTAAAEFFGAANQGFDMYLGWGESGAAILAAFGTDALRTLYLPKLVSGEWSGSMALTEPQAGTDLSLVRTRAVPVADSIYRLHGGKIFNSGGEHDLTGNIVHFVLARIEGAPAGSKGLSLFLAPKFLPDDAGGLGPRNRISCSGIEHKMGLHASATCSMEYDGATAWMVGEPGQGLAIMFHLMNHMRRRIGAISVGLSELAYQNARSYAAERLQGRAPDAPLAPGQPATSLLEQPDVQRILSEIITFTQAARGLLVWAALLSDTAEQSADLEQRARAQRMFGFLTPVLKGYFSHHAFDCCVAAQQLFGGYGYVTETGIEQVVRDARILSIAEGANGVQAFDLASRHLRDPAAAEDLGAQIDLDLAKARPIPELEGVALALASGLADWRSATAEVRKLHDDRPALSGAATDYLHLTGTLLLGWTWLRIVKAAVVASEQDVSRADHALVRRARAEFFMTYRLPETALRLARIRSSARLYSGAARAAAAAD